MIPESAEVRSPAPSVDHERLCGCNAPGDCRFWQGVLTGIRLASQPPATPSLREALERHFGEMLSPKEYDDIVRRWRRLLRLTSESEDNDRS